MAYIVYPSTRRRTITPDKVRDATRWNTKSAIRIPNATEWNTLTADIVIKLQLSDFWIYWKNLFFCFFVNLFFCFFIFSFSNQNLLCILPFPILGRRRSSPLLEEAAEWGRLVETQHITNLLNLILLINVNSRCIGYTGCFCVVSKVIPLLRWW